jgi:phosphoribosyl-dephospho-CoA transferase
MNSVDMANNLIFRAKHLQEFTVETEVPDDFRFNGLIPFDMNIVGSIIEAKVWAIDFDEAVKKLHEFLEICK